MSVQSRPRAPLPRGRRLNCPQTLHVVLSRVSHGLQSPNPTHFPRGIPASGHSQAPPSSSICVSGYHQRKLLLGTAQGGDVPKMPKQHPRTSTLIPPNSSSPSANLPVQGYDPLHESDTLIVEHRRPGKLLKSQDTHKMTLPKDLNYHCEKIRNG